MGAGRKAQRIIRRPQQPLGGGGHAAVAPQGAGRQLRVAPHAGQGLVPLPLQSTRRHDPGTHVGAGLTALLGRKVVVLHGQGLDV